LNALFFRNDLVIFDHEMGDFLLTVLFFRNDMPIFDHEMGELSLFNEKI